MPYSYHESTHLSRENALALKSLAATGELPTDHYWNALRTQHDANPTRFDKGNYVLAALLDRDQLQRQGTLAANAPLFSNTGFFSYAGAKHTLNMTRFDHWHPFLGRLFEITLPTTRPHTPAGEGLTGGTTPVPTPRPAIPLPAAPAPAAAPAAVTTAPRRRACPNPPRPDDRPGPAGVMVVPASPARARPARPLAASPPSPDRVDRSVPLHPVANFDGEGVHRGHDLCECRLADGFRRPRGDDPTTPCARFGAEVDDPVGGSENVGGMFHQDQRVAEVEKRVSVSRSLAISAGWSPVVGSSRRNKVFGPRAARVIAAGVEARKLASLSRCASPPERVVAGWPNRRVVEPYVHHRSQFGLSLGLVPEKRKRLACRQLEHLGDRLLAEPDLQHLGAIPRPVALRAPHPDVRQKLHVDRQVARPLAHPAPPPLDVERKLARREVPRLRLVRRGEQLPDLVERLQVSDRVRPRRPADRRLVDQDDVAQRLVARDLAEREAGERLVAEALASAG